VPLAACTTSSACDAACGRHYGAQRLLIVADYDSDGATACAIACARCANRRAGRYLVPNRFEYGYGLTPEIVALAKSLKDPTS